MQKNIAVFCGSQSGNNPLYEQVAIALGKKIAIQGHTLVYGGGNKGLMGAVANAVLQANGKVTGVIPELLREREHAHSSEQVRMLITPSMHARKQLMFELCHEAYILPGGFGTLDELFEMLTWNNLDIHNKIIYIINCAGFYNPLLEHIQQMQTAGFLYTPWQQMVTIQTEHDYV
jgi:uncharacterized protein (TIGR00730 family)